MTEKQDKSIAYLARTDDERMLLSHAKDLLVRAERGSTAVSDFYNMGEQYLIRAFLGQCGMTEGEDWLFYGGYPYAERRMLFLFPPFMTESAKMIPDADPADMLLSFAAEENAVGALSVSGSGYRELTHRDYLGSLLALGIERAVVGDIAVSDSSHAVIFIKNAMLPFAESALTRIGNDKVRIERLPPDAAAAVPDCRRYAVRTDTVASPRLDAIVAAAADLSRDKAKQLITSGLVEVDFRPEQAPDTILSPGAVLSVRGYGRFIFDMQNGVSKKGRLRIVIKKLI